MTTVIRQDHDHLVLWLRIGVGAVLGVLAGLLIPLPDGATRISHILIGFVVAGLAFAVPLLVMAMRLDAAGTKEHVDGLGESRNLVDVLALVAALASLGGVANMLLQPDGGPKVFEALVSVATIAVAWLMIHTVYMVRYARHYVNAQPGCITFDGDAEPRMSDFAYLSFCLGMTFQVSDQTMNTPEVRKIVFFHTLLSYVLGTGIVATTINLVAGLAG
ncbi:DUF1345 domain-containing protein [Ammonicoccus fulvus]|uniref:DUF1345 domain-containing protein n=1 Tax=Ammonicoccus fulvus TaxID=3138240 RepID=A0ABZ3FQE1_9ACTN